MSKGGGGAPPTQEVTTTTSRIPEFAEPYFQEMMGRAAYETTRPYEPFAGSRMADFNAAERAGQAGMARMAAAGAPPEMGMATNIASGVGYAPGPQQVASGYSAGSFDPGYTARGLTSQYTGQGQYGPGFEPGTIADQATLEKYTNPYSRMVTDIEKREAGRQSAIQGIGTSEQAAQTGGLGGYREAIMQSERERNLGQQMGDIERRGGQAAFQQAQQAFEADRAARLQAGQLGLQTGQAAEQSKQQAESMRQAAYRAGEQARQQAGAMGLDAQQAEDAARQAANQAFMQAQEFNVQSGYDDQQQRLAAASQLGQLGGQQQRMGYERLQNLQAMGQGRRDLEQQSLDMGYQDFLRQQRFPREQLSYLSNLIQGLPLAPMYNESASTQGGPTGVQQAITGALGGVGLYNQMAAAGGRVPGVVGVGLKRAMRAS
tara:strand:+ start:594 stop:1889 length:1296 start_codon:yes stop_codon:yes gene_type:complete